MLRLACSITCSMMLILGFIVVLVPTTPKVPIHSWFVELPLAILNSSCVALFLTLSFLVVGSLLNCSLLAFLTHLPLVYTWLW